MTPENIYYMIQTLTNPWVMLFLLVLTSYILNAIIRLVQAVTGNYPPEPPGEDD